MYKYLDFLQSMEYIAVEEGNIFPGNEITKFDIAEVERDNIGNLLLKDILDNGLRYVREDLKIHILAPYLELSCAYYLQSHFAEKILPLNFQEINRHYDDMYNRSKRKPQYQMLFNFLELSQAKIMKHKGQVFTGYEPLLAEFNNAFSGSY